MPARMVLLTLVVACLLCAGCSPQAPSAETTENLLVNPDLLTLDDKGTPRGWTHADEATRLQVVTGDAPSGRPASLRVEVNKGQAKLHTQLLQNVDTIEHDTLYVLTGWMKTDLPRGDAYLMVKLFDTEDGRNKEITRMTVASPTDRWQSFRYVFDSRDAEVASVIARIAVSPEAVGKGLWLTGLRLAEVDLNPIDVTAAGDITTQLIDRLPEPDRDGRYTITKKGGPVLGIRNFGEGAKLVFGQALRVRPGSTYRVSWQTRGWGQIQMELHDRKGVARVRSTDWEPVTLSVMTRPDDTWRDYTLTTPPAKTDTLWLNVFIRYATVWGLCEVRNLRVEPVEPTPDRPVPLQPDTPTVARKLHVHDCRGMRGFVGAPVDGSVRSRHYGYGLYEYGDGYAGQAVFYNYNAFDGLHLTLPRDGAFNYVSLRGGAHTRMVRGARHYQHDGGSTPMWTFMKRPVMYKGSPRTTRRVEPFPQSAWFGQIQRPGKVSFFDTAGGSLADLGFYVVGDRPVPNTDESGWTLTTRAVTLPKPESVYDVRNIQMALQQKIDTPAGQLLSMTTGGKPEAIALKAGHPVRFFTEPFDKEKGLGSLTLRFRLAKSTGPVKLMTVVHDPLDPRRDLHCVAWQLPRTGTYIVNLDTADQLVFAGRRVWLSLLADADCTIDRGSVHPEWMTREAALPEALAWRKFIMACQYLRLSEPRSWMLYKGGRTRKQVYEHYGPRGGRHLAELFNCIDECYAMAPDDPMVKQTRQWCMIQELEQSDAPPAPPQPDADVPAWAHYSRLGWLQMKSIARRWLEQRIVKTGEFGGRVNDDSCMYQQLTDFPHLQDDDIVPVMKDAARRFRDLTLRKTVIHGVNYNDMDSLHAYEEGMNHLALVTDWFYGDPIYIESLMESTRSVEKFTVVTDDGRRHFRNDKQGAPDVTRQRELAPDSGRRSLTMHTVLKLADYNRNPRALELATQWADTWNGFMKPGQYATSVEVKTGKVLSADKENPYRGYSQAESHIWLSDMTGDMRFVKPLVEACRDGSAPPRSVGHLVPLYHLGALDQLPDEAMKKLAQQSSTFKGYLEGDPQAVTADIVGSPLGSWGRFLSTVYHVQRWPDMMDPGKQYTDRVWFAMMERVGRIYLGGHTKRNSTYKGQAVYWRGLGDRFAAVVLVNRRDRLRVLVYNFADRALTGTMEVRRLQHGDYDVTTGPDANGDSVMDVAATTRRMTLYKAEPVTVTLPPREVTVIEARLVESKPTIFTRADLAIVDRETARSGRVVTGVLHNIGSSTARDVQVACIDGATGEVLGMTTINEIEAPLDLMPRRVTFRIELDTAPKGKLTVTVDPLNRIPEIYERNNTATPE